MTYNILVHNVTEFCCLHVHLLVIHGVNIKPHKTIKNSIKIKAKISPVDVKTTVSWLSPHKKESFEHSQIPSFSGHTPTFCKLCISTRDKVDADDSLPRGQLFLPGKTNQFDLLFFLSYHKDFNSEKPSWLRQMSIMRPDCVLQIKCSCSLITNDFYQNHIHSRWPHERMKSVYMTLY